MMKSLMIIFFALISANIAFAGKGDKSLGGCGLGWQVAPRHSMVSVTTRAITNAYTTSFGMTSGTSGCATHSIVMEEKKDIHFMEANYSELIVTLAQGEGESLEGLSRSLGCSDAQYDHFSQTLKSNYGYLYSNGKNPADLLKSVKSVMQSNGVCAASI